MADVYSLLTNEYVKSIVSTYTTNSFKYKEYLVRKYLRNFFEIELSNFESYLKYSSSFILDNFISNIRWYISESYLEDIRTLNGKVDLKEFLSKFQPYWDVGIFNNIYSWLDFYYEPFDIRFGSSEGSSEDLECCFLYQGYRLTISHEYIKLNYFNKKFYNLYLIYTPLLNALKVYPNLEEVYNNIRNSYKDSPDYKIKDGFLVLQY